jgi:hypothetical protein
MLQILQKLRHPRIHTFQRTLICQVKNKRDSLRPSIIYSVDASEAFLSSSIPQLEGDLFILMIAIDGSGGAPEVISEDSFTNAINSNGGLGELVENVFGIFIYYAGLADSLVAQQNHFEGHGFGLNNWGGSEK